MKSRVSTVCAVMVGAFLLGDLGAAHAQPAHAAYVLNANDAGPGSFRAAVDQANANATIGRIQFLGRARVIGLRSPVTYTGHQSLVIDGNGSALNGAGISSGPAFAANGGGSLVVAALTVSNAPAEGIDIQVPSNAGGTIRLSLLGVTVTGNKGHGVLVNDQVDSSTQDGVPPNPAGSSASVAVVVAGTRFAGNGFSVSDRDGLRVNEGGDGDLSISIALSVAEDNAADGIEVDERGAGDVRVDMTGTKVLRNGRFDPEDLDDGFDIDEYGPGSIVGRVLLSAANDNYEEGFDFNENDAGDLRVDLAGVEASRNREEGIDYEEDDDFAGGGDLVSVMFGVRANGNGVDGGDAGLKIREKGEGVLNVALDVVETLDNLSGGIAVREDAIGSLTATVKRATSLRNVGHGIDFDENRSSATDAGDLTARVSTSSSSNNGGAGVRADQQTPGVGTLTLAGVTLDGNGGGATAGTGVTVTTAP